MNYSEMTVADLRKEAGRKGIGSGVWRAGAGKDVLLRALSGEDVGGTVPAPSGLEQTMAAALAPFLKASIGREEFDELANEWAAQSDTIAAQAKDLASLREKLEAGEFASKGGGAALTVSFASPLASATVEGLAHRQLSQIVKWTAAGIPVWMWGAPGWGKSTMAHQVGAALGLPALVIPIDPTMTAGKLLGFRSLATGEFMEGFLFRPFRDGGVVLLDELDAGDEGVIAALNSLLANGSYLFPNGETIQKHANFRILAGANTKGTGPVAGFTARTRLDAATLDRFAVIEIGADEGLEMAVVCGGASESKQWTCPGPLSPAAAVIVCRNWVKYVQKVRATVGQSVLVSPRASYLGAAALRAGIPIAEVADALLFKLASPDTKENILRRCGQPGAALA